MCAIIGKEILNVSDILNKGTNEKEKLLLKPRLLYLGFVINFVSLKVRIITGTIAFPGKNAREMLVLLHLLVGTVCTICHGTL